jgi:hypothetical protein
MPLIYTPILWTSDELNELLGSRLSEALNRSFHITGIRLRAEAVEAGDLFIARGSGNLDQLVQAAADRGAVAVMKQKDTALKVPAHIHTLEVDDVDAAAVELGDARRERSDARILLVVGNQNQAEAMLIAELLGQQGLGYLADGPVGEGLMNLSAHPKRAVFFVQKVLENSKALCSVKPDGLLILNPADCHVGGLKELLAAMGENARVALPASEKGEVSTAIADSAAQIVRFGRDASADLHLVKEEKTGSTTRVELAGISEVVVEMATQNPAVDRCLAAIAGAWAGHGDVEKTAFALTVLSIAAASAEQMQLRQMSQQTTTGGQANVASPAPVDVPAPELSDEHRAEIGDIAFAAVNGEKKEPSAELRTALERLDGPVYVALRERRARLREAWGEGADAIGGLAAAIENMMSQLGPTGDKIDSIETCFSFGYRGENLAQKGARNRVRANVFRGIRGVEFSHQGYTVRVSPTATVSTNRDIPKVINNFCQQRGLSEDQFYAQVQCRVFEGVQILAQKKDDAVKAWPMIRGNTLVPVETISRETVEGLQNDLGNFLCKSVQEDGRMVYLYYPSRGTEDLKANNMIRQWMATCALCRTGRFRGDDQKIYDLAEKNIRYNLRKFYSTSGKLGLIEWGNKVKLGAVALAALSIFEHPKRKQFKRVESKLSNLIEHLWQEDGSFITFFKPAGRNDVQNFYPGEAQLYRAFCLEDKPDDKLMDRFMRAFRYYREWHFDNRNPAFIPWHTQAYYKVWKMTQDEELKEWIFTVNDWLLGMQQGLEVRYPDCVGRFHDPKRPQFGPPHASSTGVYMEGLIDAFELARAVGDEARTERYRLSIVNGLRSLKQVMFKDERDMYYVRKSDYLQGGVRTTVYNNVMRIDNVQHNQMAILKILRAFKDEDFSHLPKT